MTSQRGREERSKVAKEEGALQTHKSIPEFLFDPPADILKEGVLEEAAVEAAAPLADVTSLWMCFLSSLALSRLKTALVDALSWLRTNDSHLK